MCLVHTIFTILSSFSLGQFEKLDKECKLEERGYQYMGTISRTITNTICQSWSVQLPHNHQRVTPKLFPDEEISDAENFCRNTGQADSGFNEPIWCLTLNVSSRYEACEVPMCGETFTYFFLSKVH